jgi:hypothetical protein
MTTKKELYFLTIERCGGALFYHNVYSFYDEPLIFSALNEYGQLFFCYSLGCDASHDRWIVVPTSQDKVNQLEQKDIPIIKMMKDKLSSKVLHIKVDLRTQEVSEEQVAIKNLHYKMPLDDVFIRENVNYDGKRKFSHRVRIAKESNVAINSKALSDVFKDFGKFLRHFMGKHKIPIQMFPEDAIRGSFVYRVKAKSENEEQFRSIGYDLLSRISSTEGFIKSLQQREFDLRIVRKFFDSVLNNKVSVELIDVESTATLLKIEPNGIKAMSSAVNDMLGSYLDSTMVPQADSLDRLKKYLGIVDKGRVVTAEELGVDKRQVSYYRDACRLLSLVHDYSFLTPLGSKVVASQKESEWIPIIRRQFEESDCGNIWMLNQKVDSILDIDESTAGQFLIDNCNGLSENTSQRRASTLRSWVRKFKEVASTPKS